MVTKRKPPEEKLKAGRPSSYKPHYADEARRYCKIRAATDAELADFFEVSIGTITNWKNAHPEFLASVKTGKEIVDDRVEESLFQRATGYSYDSEKIFCKDGDVTRVPVREHVPPETLAQIFWLKNRRPELWRDRQDHHHSGAMSFLSMSPDDLLAEIRAEAAALGMRVMLPSPKKRGGVQIDAEAEEDGE